MANYLHGTAPLEHNGDIWYFYTMARALKIDEARKRIKKNIEKRRKKKSMLREKNKKARHPKPVCTDLRFGGYVKWLETLV